jgi:hypothetical protein
MARRKPRKGAGPPPAASPRRAALAASDAKAAPKRKSNEPVPREPRGVFIRAGIVALAFYPYLVFIAGESPGVSAIISVAAFSLMVPLGLFLDRVRYNRQMRKYQEKRAGSARR